MAKLGNGNSGSGYDGFTGYSCRIDVTRLSSTEREYVVCDERPRCAYCGRRDTPDRYGNCNGCGSPRLPDR